MAFVRTRQILYFKLINVLKVICGVSIALDTAIWIFQYFENCHYNYSFFSQYIQSNLSSTKKVHIEIYHKMNAPHDGVPIIIKKIDDVVSSIKDVMPLIVRRVTNQTGCIDLDLPPGSYEIII